MIENVLSISEWINFLDCIKLNSISSVFTSPTSLQQRQARLDSRSALLWAQWHDLLPAVEYSHQKIYEMLSLNISALTVWISSWLCDSPGKFTEVSRSPSLATSNNGYSEHLDVFPCLLPAIFLSLWEVEWVSLKIVHSRNNPSPLSLDVLYVKMSCWMKLVPCFVGMNWCRVNRECLKIRMWEIMTIEPQEKCECIHTRNQW